MAAAFVLYLLLSLLFFGRGLLGRFSTFHIGVGADAPLMMWYLAWWPHALAARINPFLTHAYWAPDGFNLTWSTSIPLLSLLASPITAAYGPVAALNIFCLLALAVDAWCAFLLCQYLSKNYWSSLLGGYVFGFSPTLLGQIYFARLHSLWVFALPLIVYLTVRRLSDDIRPRWFVALTSLLLVAQFFSSSEIFATATLFGSMALALGWLAGPADTRRRLLEIASHLFYALVIVLLLISPYLYVMFHYPRPYSGPIWDERMLSADVLNFLIPTPINQLGRLSLFDSISAPFNLGLPSEQVAYLSWPLIVIALLFARKFWHEPRGRFLFDSLIIVLACSLGPVLMLGAHPTKIILPWALFRWSLLANVAPARLSMYAFLILAVMVSLWLPAAFARRWMKISVGLLVFAGLLPDLSAAFWISPSNTPRFFRSVLYRNYIAAGETVFIFPAWPESDSMLWQAQTGMYFNLADGPGAWPVQIAKWPIVESFTRQIYLPGAANQFRGYLVNHGVTTVVVTQSRFELWSRLLSSLGQPVPADDVLIYKLTPTAFDRANLELSKLREQFDDQRFEVLLTRVNRYLAGGGNTDHLTVENLLNLRLIPPEDISGLPNIPGLRHPERKELRNPRYRYGMLLFTTGNRLVVIGESIWYPDAKRLMAKYREVATESAFVEAHGSTAVSNDSVGIMVMSFTRDQLAKAAAIAGASTPTDDANRHAAH